MATSRWSDIQHFSRQKFDYLIVGGGTAGSVVAARLSEDPDIVVGLIEAGLEVSDNIFVDHPGRYGQSFNTDIDYAYKTLPQQEADGRMIDVPRGKGLGGSSLLNFMLWMRPNRRDLDQWSDFGNVGWSFDELKSYYKKSERVEQPLDTQQQKYRFELSEADNGYDGPVPISFCKDVCLSALPFYEALDTLKVPVNQAPLSGDHNGVWTALANVDPSTGIRAHAARAYLYPNIERPNLHVLTGAMVNKIVLEKVNEHWSATGVELTHGGRQYTILATRETLICAGSYSSPLLLERSGIGQPEVLKNAGVEVKIHNVNVGENLQDHSMVAIVYEVDNSTPNLEDLTDSVLVAKADAQLAVDQSTDSVQAMLAWTVAYLKLSDFVDLDELRQELIDDSESSSRFKSIMSKYLADSGCGQMEYIPIMGNFAPAFTPASDKKYMTLLQILQHPFSTGSVHTRPMENASGSDDLGPIIDPKLFDKRSGGINDLKIHAAALKHIVERMEETGPMSGFIEKRVWPTEEAVNVPQGWESWTRSNVGFDWHPVGTCPMDGIGGAQTGVVDERLRVYGVPNLRVIDASIMPLIVNSHPQATVFAIGEKASDMIKADRLDS